MENEQIAKVRKGLECCKDALDSCVCPDDCPYTDRCWAENGTAETEDPMCAPVIKDALELIEEEYTTRLLPFDELMESKGMGWAEIWFREDEETEESKELFEIVFIGPHYICADGDTGCVSVDTYNKPYHTRIWSGVDAPTDEQREAEAWS